MSSRMTIACDIWLESHVLCRMKQSQVLYRFWYTTITNDNCSLDFGLRKAFERMIEYFRARVMGVLKESPGLSDPENADVLVATMNGLTDEAWALGC